ncbi:MAG: hypothetical protein KGL90_05625 [Burkholderiales bacterium]|nr:hypothetical protein [Burkholderiales bacterium]
MNRRTLTLSLLALGAGATLSLSGCGFELRHPPVMAFRSIQLVGFAGNSPLASELARALESAGVSVVSTTAAAAALGTAGGASGAQALSRHAVLEALSDTRDQVVASNTAFGQVRDLSLRTGFRFRLTRANGGVVIAPTQLMLARDLTYDEKDALAKLDESAALHRAMQTDIVEQVMRRLAVVQPEQLAAP